MQVFRPRLAALLAALLAAAGPAAALDLDALWDYSRPSLTEERLAAALAGATDDERLIVQAPIARTWGLRRDFDRAREVLPTVEPALGKASPAGRARYFLELGRTCASGTCAEALRTPANLEAARGAFVRPREVAGPR